MKENQIGTRLSSLREKKAVSQKEVAEILGITQTAYGKIEAGQRGLSSEYCVRLADYYDTTCDFILRGINANNVEIHRNLGLSETSIELLSKAKQSSDDLQPIYDYYLPRAGLISEHGDDSEREKLNATAEQYSRQGAQFFFINQFLESALSSGQYAVLFLEIADSMLQYLSSCRFTGDPTHAAKMKYRKEISAAKYEASKLFDRFLDKMARSPELLQNTVFYNIDEFIAYGKENGILDQERTEGTDYAE